MHSGKFFLIGNTKLTKAAALREIDEDKLFHPSKSIYVYAKDRFQFSRRTTNTYLCCANVYESIVEDTSLPIPNNISHIRSLHKFAPQVRRYIWKHVCATGDNITEELVVAMTLKYESGATFSDGANEFYTPKELIDAGKQVIGKDSFDVDPASSLSANSFGEIAHYIYDEAQNGLYRKWFGDVWLSAPLMEREENVQGSWFVKAQEKYASGEISSCLCLMQVEYELEWFQLALSYPHCVLQKKPVFRLGDGNDVVAREKFVVVYL